MPQGDSIFLTPYNKKKVRLKDAFNFKKDSLQSKFGDYLGFLPKQFILHVVRLSFEIVMHLVLFSSRGLNGSRTLLLLLLPPSGKALEGLSRVSLSPFSFLRTNIC